jgi:proteasome accessory factor C
MTGRRSVRPAEERLRRLLVMLPWLMERGEVAVSEAAARFDLSDDEVIGDLELASVCGLPPFVDELIDVFIDEGMIFVGVPRLFTRPLRLNSVEAFELLAAARAAMELPGADPEGALARGLSKLATALGEDDTAGVKFDIPAPPLVDRLATSVKNRAQLEIEYLAADRDESSVRTILPRQVFTDHGDWYVNADDERSGEVRTFRVDRIVAAEPTGAVLEPSSKPLPVPGAWFGDASLPRAVVRVAPAARWVVERFPVDSVVDEGSDERDSWSTVTLPVASEQWLVRTMLRLGPEAELVEPIALRELIAEAADRVLSRYTRS